METYSEENYMKAIYQLSENATKTVSTKNIAELIKSKPSSVTDMMQKLAVKKLVKYKKYQGVSLTKEGTRKTMHVIRKHRLWELFLVQQLGFSWDEVHDVAEQLEHVKSPLLVDRLDEFLEYPTTDPHGDPIPDAAGNMRVLDASLLSEAEVQQKYTVACVKDSSAALLKYLDKIEIGLQTELKIVERFDYDNSLLVEVAGKEKVTISEKVCNNLFVNII